MATAVLTVDVWKPPMLLILPCMSDMLELVVQLYSQMQLVRLTVIHDFSDHTCILFRPLLPTCGHIDE